MQFLLCYCFFGARQAPQRLIRLRLYVPFTSHDVVLWKLNRLVAQFLGSFSLFSFIMLRFLFRIVFLPCVLMDEVLVCAICRNASPARDLVTVRAKGSNGINRASILRNDNVSVAPGQGVHSNCHPTCISKNNRRYENASSQLVTNQHRRSAKQAFQDRLLFFGNKVDFKYSDTSRIFTL